MSAHIRAQLCYKVSCKLEYIMTTWKNRKKFRLQQAVSFLCQPETFLAAGGAASASRMDMMAQFMPRPGIKKLN